MPLQPTIHSSHSSAFQTRTSNRAIPLLKLFPWLPIKLSNINSLPWPTRPYILPTLHPLCFNHWPCGSQTFQTQPTSGSLHLPFPLPGMQFLHVPVTSSFSLFRFHHVSSSGEFHFISIATSVCTSIILGPITQFCSLHNIYFYI